MSRSNILLIMTDQQRFDSLGAYGCTAIRTPNLDRLAGGGVLFESCYVNNTICTPSRASILTGRPIQGHGVYQLHDTLPDDQVLFPKHLQSLGYQTALVGKLHVSGRLTEAVTRHPNDGFEIYEWCIDPTIHLDSPYNAYAQWLRANHPSVWSRLQSEGRKMRGFPAEAHLNHWAAERTIDFLQSRDADRPFFCFMSLFDPHDPYYDSPPEWADAVELDSLGPPQSLPETGAPYPRAIELEQKRWSSRLEGAGPYADLDEIRRGYYASIAYLDHEIGRVLDHLDESGLAGETLVLFLSDHGDMVGDRRLLTKGPYFYDPCARVPMIARFPAAARVSSRISDEALGAPHPSGLRYAGLIQPNDVAATVLAAAGMSDEELTALVPHSMDLAAAVAAGNMALENRDNFAAAAQEAVGRQTVGIEPGPRRSLAICEYRNTGYGIGGRYYAPEVHATMVHDGRYKMSLYHETDNDVSTSTGELYDMTEDPGETRNLWTDPSYADVKLRLALRLADWNAEVSKTYVGGRGGERTPWNEGAQVYVP